MEKRGSRAQKQLIRGPMRFQEYSLPGLSQSGCLIPRSGREFKSPAQSEAGKYPLP